MKKRRRTVVRTSVIAKDTDVDADKANDDDVDDNDDDEEVCQISTIEKSCFLIRSVILCFHT